MVIDRDTVSGDKVALPACGLLAFSMPRVNVALEVRCSVDQLVADEALAPLLW